MNIRHSMRLILAVLPYVVGVMVVKLLVHRSGWELISPNAIFTALIGATVFLIGFLISGVLSDYKESEKIPGEIAAIVLTLADEIRYLESRNVEEAFLRERLEKILDLVTGIRKWLHKETGTKEIMLAVEELSREFVLLEKHAAPNYVARLKQEQNNLRKLLVRIQTIRDTDFVFSGYFIASTTTFLLIVGMVFLRIEPFYESLFFVGLVTYLLIFLLKLIRDLDDPFGYTDESSGEDVSIRPIEDAIARLEGMLGR